MLKQILNAGKEFIITLKSSNTGLDMARYV